ncbi:pyridoxamine 5'-phosphate oxidase family protein [Anaerolineae bacterium CFX9]|nr:pyridoxamine 5'-phosphate oxidase family protein [Oscillatoria laete-virens]MDL1899416.1 pyridoxamine 5'-phosphate oxidase family protein [Anaerolineae bacterium CFX9]MDL5052883.1 pyridoxamine 5'-phosphate oxidase family protein [Oscillatoria laete-virens NRMC-F 0139]
MAKFFDAINDSHREFIEKQHVFFVASAPLTADGHVNLSPKGLDSLRVFSPHHVAYADMTGSGNETSAHLRENGRITFMFCSFEGNPLILRLYGRGTTVLPGTPEWDELAPHFTLYPGVRQIISAQIHSVQTSCGFAVPKMDFVEDRHKLIEWSEAKGTDGLNAYREKNNLRSIDGLATALCET